MTQFTRKTNDEDWVQAADINALQEAIEQQSFNVLHYGAVGDGVTDDTAAIDAAVQAVASATQFAPYDDVFFGDYIDSAVLCFPPGRYVYNGSVLWDHTALEANTITIVGAGPGATQIILDDDSYLVTNTAQNVVNLRIENLSTMGGAGIFRDTRTGTNVLRPAIVRNCVFQGYAGAAFNINSSDWPYWVFEGVTFMCHSATDRPIGIAVANASAALYINRCRFAGQYIGIKAGGQGNGIRVRDCDFIPDEAPTGIARIPLWIVATSDTTTGGAVGEIAGNKFGNEGLIAGDYHILFADEGAGDTVAEKLPVLNADSTNYVIGLKIGQNTFCGNATWEAGGGTSTQYIYSTTPNIFRCDIGPIQVIGTPADMVLRLRTAAHVYPVWANSVGPLFTDLGVSRLAVSNAFQDLPTINPNGALAPLATTASAAELFLPAGSDVITVTGTTNITSINTITAYAGRVVTLVFADVLTFTDGSNLKLAGDFVTSAADTITLVCDGTNWYEAGRSAN